MKRFWIFKTWAVVALLSALLVFINNDNHLHANEQPGNEDINPSQVKMSENKNDFACNLFRTINEQKKGNGSIIVSPISVSYVLGMLNEGADGETRRQIIDLLGPGCSVEEINRYFKKLSEDVSNADPMVTVKTANGIYVKSGFDVLPQYKNDMQKYYGAQIDAINFDKSNIVDNINKWCKAHTDGMIPELLRKEELNDLAVMYLLNAVFFKAPWSEIFDPQETRDDYFTKQDGTTVMHRMMHLETKAAYGHNNLCETLCLPYGNKSYSMYVLLPREGKTVGDIIRNLSSQKLEQYEREMTTCRVDILMPRFTTESETNLEAVLSSMGMPRAFGRSAEFPNMARGHRDDLYVSKMKQKAKIEVNEEGTKAAAATVAEVAERGMVSAVSIVEFHATRPFVYYIKEKSTGTILFMGAYCGEEGKKTEVKYFFQEGKKSDAQDMVFKASDQMPQFPGGEKALLKYLHEHVVYPPEAAKDSIQGKVVLQFIVDSLGYVSEVKVVRSVHELLDQEAIRVVKTLPRFAPGRNGGKAVSVWYTLPVTFKLKSREDEEKSNDAKKDVIVKYNAQFPGGEEALAKYIKDNTKYPPKAAKKKIHGRVTVGFLVDKTGKVCNVRVIDSSNDKDLDREAVRVIKSLPRFTPASVNGEPVDIWVHQNVRFDIPGIRNQWMKSVKVQPK